MSASGSGGGVKSVHTGVAAATPGCSRPRGVNRWQTLLPSPAPATLTRTHKRTHTLPSRAPRPLRRPWRRGCLEFQKKALLSLSAARRSPPPSSAPHRRYCFHNTKANEAAGGRAEARARRCRMLPSPPARTPARPRRPPIYLPISTYPFPGPLFLVSHSLPSSSSPLSPSLPHPPSPPLFPSLLPFLTHPPLLPPPGAHRIPGHAI